MTSDLAMEFTHACLLVDDYHGTLEFYRDVLGFELSFSDEGSGYADFDTGEATVALYDREKMADTVPSAGADAGGDRAMLSFSVESVDEIAERLDDAGYNLETEPTKRRNWGVRVAHFRDPEGILIEINEAL